MSLWFLYKIRDPAHTKHRLGGIKWLRTMTDSLSPADRDDLRRLEAWGQTLLVKNDKRIDTGSRVQPPLPLPSPVINGHTVMKKEQQPSMDDGDGDDSSSSSGEGDTGRLDSLEEDKLQQSNSSRGCIPAFVHAALLFATCMMHALRCMRVGASFMFLVF